MTCQGHILLFQADEVNAGGGFEPVPKAKIDDGFVPDIKHLAAHGRSLSQHFLGQAFEGMHIMFFLAAGGGQTSRACVGADPRHRNGRWHESSHQ